MNILCNFDNFCIRVIIKRTNINSIAANMHAFFLLLTLWRINLCQIKSKWNFID